MIPAGFAIALSTAALLASPALGADLAEIRSRGTLRVIVAADEAPETFELKGGSRPGFEHELVRTFARLQGWPPESQRSGASKPRRTWWSPCSEAR